MFACSEPRMLLNSIYVGQACGMVARRAAVFDKIVVVGDVHEAEPRAELYRRLGVDVVVYPLPAGKAPTLVSLIRLISSILPYAGERVLIEGFGGEGVVAAALLVVYGFSARHAAQKVLSLGHGLTTPLESRILRILELILNDSPRGFETLSSLVKRAFDKGFAHGDAHASSVAELAVELNMWYSILTGTKLENNYTLFEEGLLNPDTPSKPIVAAASALDMTLVGAVKTVAFEPRGSILEVYIGCETIFHREQCWPEVNAANPYLESLFSKLGFRKIVYIMAMPEDVACRGYADVDRGLCEEE